MSIFKRGNVYWYHFWFNGQHIQESSKQGNPRVARNIESAHRVRLAKAAAGIEEPTLAPIFSDFAEEFIKLVKDERRAQTHRRYSVSLVSLKKAFASKRLSEITSEEIDRFKQARLQSGRKGSTINRDLACLRRLLRVAVKRNKLRATPSPMAE
jgi:hypothetical protein